MQLKMNKLDKLYNEWIKLQPLKPEYQKRLDEKFMLEFNFNSNHIEGNTLTYGQTELLLIFGKTSGDASIRDYEEMKAHNVGLNLVKLEAKDKERPLTENFIRELNRVILVENFMKPSHDGKSMYEIKVGEYKSLPNHVFTKTGEVFNYASPEETPAMMGDLVNWYNGAEKENNLHPVELASLFHYRFIRIHPFQDGNGRIARLLVNYILLKHGYPMIIVPSKDKEKYLDSLNKSDIIIGLNPSKGAYAYIEQIEPFVDYMKGLLIFALEISIRAAKGESIEDSDDWKKELTLLKSHTKTAPFYTPDLAKQAIEESFIPLIKRIDNELFPFYELFDQVQLVDSSNRSFDIKNIDSSQFNNKNKNWCSFRFAKKLVEKGSCVFHINIFIVFKDDLFRLYFNTNDNGEEKSNYNLNYGEKINEIILKEFSSEIGSSLAEFVRNVFS